MKNRPFISGFTFLKNATSLYYPFVESIQSILPIVDEFVIALGKGNEDDNTLAELQKINSDKIKIIPTEWNIAGYPTNTIYAQQTDLAKQACQGEWLFYLQGDELIHEQDLDKIYKACQKYKENKQVEGFLFKYLHFYGDYYHYHNSHSWYPREIRIIRNLPDIHSFGDAQSFRRIPNFDMKDYLNKKNTFKLRVVNLNVYVYHYGHVIPPRFMQKKQFIAHITYYDSSYAQKIFENRPSEYAYGPLGNLSIFKDTHPKLMTNWLNKFDWANQLNYTKKRLPHEPLHKHRKLKNRILTFIEKKILGYKHKSLGYKNWKIVGTEK